MTLPNFLLAGAAKSGTTALFHYLRSHPDVFMARQKECHYWLRAYEGHDYRGPGDRAFNRLLISDRSAYEACFDARVDERAVGESSVYYLYRPQALARALACADDRLRVVLILRRPDERALSAWRHQIRDGHEIHLRLDDALRDEDQRVAAGWAPPWHYRRVSCYASQVTQAMAIVGRENVHVELYDDLYTEPAKCVYRVFSFLGVDPDWPVARLPSLNRSGRSRSRVVNHLLVGDSRLRAGAKRVIPYDVGVRLREGIMRINTGPPAEIDRQLANELTSMFAYDIADLEDVLRRRLDQWRSGT